jgi:hypothetical protein
MDNSTIRFPIKCLCCGRESLVVSNRDMIENALATERNLIISSACVYHRVMWVASEIERNQIRDYAEALHCYWSQQSRSRRYG